MATVEKLFKLGLIALIRIYRFAFSALCGPCCRFEPTCSAYAMAVIERYGALRGARLALSRVLRCHPWHVGGIDPIP